MIHGPVSLVAVTFFLLATQTNKDFISSITTANFFSQGTNSDNDEESLLSLKPPSDLALLYNQFNNTSPEKNNDPENVVNSKFYDSDQIQFLKFLDKHKSLALFHINACSLTKILMILTIYSNAQIKYLT